MSVSVWRRGIGRMVFVSPGSTGWRRTTNRQRIETTQSQSASR